jgi:hypothetical protein
MRRKFDQFMANRDGGKTVGASPEQNAALFEQFLEWQKASAAKPSHPAQTNVRKRTSRAAAADGH